MTTPKMRVHEIAKEMGIPSKDLLAKIHALGIEAKSHQSSLDADDVDKIKRTLARERGGSAPAESKGGAVASGAPVLRRRSGGKPEEVAPAPAPDRSGGGTAGGAPAPVVRRRAHADEVVA